MTNLGCPDNGGARIIDVRIIDVRIIDVRIIDVRIIDVRIREVPLYMETTERDHYFKMLKLMKHHEEETTKKTW